jgi:phosphatidylglycerophosphate synthase
MNINKNGGRKIPPEFENPIDDKILELCDNMVNSCLKYKITPNMVTIVRIIISLFVFYYLFFTCNVIEPIIGSAVFYIMDCLDGHLARSTGQVTVLGDYLDHYADIFYYLFVLAYILLKSYNNKYYIIIGFGLLTYASLVHLGLQQKNYKILAKRNKVKPEQETNKAVKITKKILHEIDEIEDELLDDLNCLHNLSPQNIKWTRFFGTGTLYSVILIIIYYIQSNCESAYM